MKISRTIVNNFPLLLLVAAIGFSPSIELGRIAGGKAFELRAEDIVLVVLGLVWLWHITQQRRVKFQQLPLLLPLLLWYGIGFVSTLTGWLFQSVEFQRSFFFFAKEVEFLLIYVYVFYRIQNMQTIRWVLYLLGTIGAVHIGWILFQIAFGLQITYHYSYTTFIEPDGTSPGGGFLLLIFLFLLNIYLYTFFLKRTFWIKKISLLALISLPILGVLTSGSRGVLLSLIGSIFLTAILFGIARGILSRIAFAGIIFSLVAGSLLFVGMPDEDPAMFQESTIPIRLFAVDRFIWEVTSDNPTSRISIWNLQLEYFSNEPLSLFFGHGKSIIIAGQQSHNYYLQTLGEVGIVGVALFVFLIFAITRIAFQGFIKSRDGLTIGMSAGLLVATFSMLLMSLVAETFQVVKIAEMYWVILAVTMSALYMRKKEIHEE